MPIAAPLDLQKWINDNRELLKPPVGNKQIYIHTQDFIVMVVGGPNARKDYHYNESEELFYQLEGTITLKIVEDNIHKDIEIGQGQMFLLPARIPHSPRRGKDTVGLVIEMHRQADAQDGFIWFCENCGNKLHAHFAHITDIVSQLPPIMNTFFDSQDLRTCKVCHTIIAKP